MNRTDVQAARVKRKLQIESASSNIDFSPLPPNAPEIMERRLKEILFKNRFMITGNVITAIAIIAIVPQEAFKSERLALRVLKVSFTDAPTIGTRFPMANLAVFILRLSAP